MIIIRFAQRRYLVLKVLEMGPLLVAQTLAMGLLPAALGWKWESAPLVMGLLAAQAWQSVLGLLVAPQAQVQVLLPV